MPTIYDSYRIEWDGNSLSCENDVIIGYNTSNKTRLEFVNTSLRADVRFTSIEFRTPLSRIGFDLPDDGKIELSLNPVLYGADSDLALFWEADDGNTGAAHMRVMIVESEYYHDEETEAQADDNTQEINQLKARVEENYNTLSDSVGLLTTEVESNATQIESLQAKADRALISSLQLVGTPISNVDNFFAIPFNALSVEFTIRFPAGATINGSIIGVSYYSTASAIASQLIATQNMLGRDATPQPNSLLLKLDLVNQSAILCKNVAVSNNSELQEASDVYDNTYFKNAGISGHGVIRGVAFKFTGLGTPVVSALAVTAQVRTRYSDSGGAP